MQDIQPIIATKAQKRVSQHHPARWIYRIVFGFLGMNFLASIFQGIIVSGFGSLPTADQFSQVYLFQIAMKYPLVFWPFLLALVALSVWGVIIDRRYTIFQEHAQLQHISHTATVAAEQVVATKVEPMSSIVATLQSDVAKLGSVNKVNSWNAPQDGLPLPPAATGLLDRKDERVWLEQHLTTIPNGVWGVCGIGGIGKTALVSWCLNELKHTFTGGIAVIRANNLQVADVIIRQLTLKFMPNGQDILARAGMTSESLYSLLKATFISFQDQLQRFLVIIDNIESELISQLKPVTDLITSSGGSVVLTSRERLPAWLVTEQIVVNKLDTQTTAALFTKLSQRKTGTATDLESVYTILDGHALSVVVAAADLEQHPLESIADYKKRLSGAVLDLVGPDAPEGVSRVFASTFEQLPEESQQLFTALGALTGRGSITPAVLALGNAVGQGDDEARAALERLIRAELVTLIPANKQDFLDTIDIHPLVKEFAQRLFSLWSSDKQNVVYSALATFFAAWTQHISQQIQSDDDFMGANAIIPIIRAEDENIVAALEWADRHAPESNEAIAGIIYGLRRYWWIQGKIADNERWLLRGYVIMKELGANWGSKLASITYMLGDTRRRYGDMEGARSYYGESLVMFQHLQDRESEGRAFGMLGDIARLSGHLENALDYYQSSLAIRRQVGDIHGEGLTLWKLATVEIHFGHLDIAKSYCDQSIELLQSMHDHWGEAVVWTRRGDIAHVSGNADLARQHYLQALAIQEAEGDPQGQGATLTFLGDTELNIALDKAQQDYEQALKFRRDVADIQGEGITLQGLGDVARLMGDFTTANSYYSQSLTIRRQVEDRIGESSLLRSIALMKAQQGNTTAAVADLRSSLLLARETKEIWQLVGTLEALGSVLSQFRPDTSEEYCSLLTEAETIYSNLGLQQGYQRLHHMITDLGCTA